MRRQFAIFMCVGIVVIMGLLRILHVSSWFWTAENVAMCWFIVGIWLGKVNLRRTHTQLVQDELSGRSMVRSEAPLGRALITAGTCLSAVAIVLYFATE